MTELLTQAAHDPTYWHGGWWFLAPLFWIGIWILLIFLIRGLFWRRWRRRYHQHGWGGWHGWPGSENDPRTILAGRYARGEIDETEYRQRLSVLNTPQNNPPS